MIYLAGVFCQQPADRPVGDNWHSRGRPQGLVVCPPRQRWYEICYSYAEMCACLLNSPGAVSSTLSMLLVDPKNTGALDAGLYGFNGFLVGEAMGNFVSTGEDFDGSFGTSYCK